MVVRKVGGSSHPSADMQTVTVICFLSPIASLCTSLPLGQTTFLTRLFPPSIQMFVSSRLKIRLGSFKRPGAPSPFHSLSMKCHVSVNHFLTARSVTIAIPRWTRVGIFRTRLG